MENAITIARTMNAKSLIVIPPFPKLERAARRRPTCYPIKRAIELSGIR